MIAVAIDTTYQSVPLDHEREIPFLARTATDIQKPSLETESTIAFTHNSQNESVVFSCLRSPWLVATLSSISDFRGAEHGWDGIDAAAPGHPVLDTAEMLTAHFNGAPIRPTFSVDALGRPTFSSTAENFYLHLTIDAPERLTWYAEVDGEEFFQDNVQFGGRKLPPDLANILKVS
jgi:hypothetical protein